jgi:hypothetical protein
VRRLLILVLCVVALDLGGGAVLHWMFLRTDSGERGGLSNFALKRDTDILVLGSSRAQFQIMPSVISDRLSLHAFNAGLKGHDFLYSAALYDLWARRHSPPRAVVLTVDVESFLHRPTEAAATQVLAPYVGESDLLREILKTDGPQKSVELLFRTYRYNGKVLVIAKNLFTHTDPKFDGFLAQTGTLRSIDTQRMQIPNALDQEKAPMAYARAPFWEMKLEMLRRLGAQASRHDTIVLLIHAPLYHQDLAAHKIWIDRMRSVVAEMPGIEFVDLCEAARPASFPNERELFYDVNHLNAQGAAILSNLVADELQQRLAKRP